MLDPTMTTLLPADVPVDVDTFFFDEAGPLTRWFARRRQQRRAEALAKARDALRMLLREGEVVQFAAQATAYSGWELYMMGWAAYAINRTLLVTTSERLLLLQLDLKGRPLSFVNQVQRSAVRKVKRRWLGNGYRVLTGGRTLGFMGARKDSAHMDALFPEQPDATGALEYLCPQCGHASSQHLTLCEACGLEMRTPVKAGLRSTILPGFGLWYLGHRRIGGALMAVNALFWLAVVAGARAPTEAPSGPATDTTDGVGLVVALVLVTVFHATQAAIGYAQGRKGMCSPDHAVPSRASSTHVEGSIGGPSTPFAVR
jgi:hypothetical protein